MAASTGGHGASYRPSLSQSMPRPSQDSPDSVSLPGASSRYAHWDGTTSPYRDNPASRLRDERPAYTKHASSSASFSHTVASHQPYNIQNKMTSFPRPVGSYASYPEAKAQFDSHLASDKISPYSPSSRLIHSDDHSENASSTSRAETYRPGHQTKYDIMVSSKKETRDTAFAGYESGVFEDSLASSATYSTTLNKAHDSPYGNSVSTGRVSDVPRHMDARRQPVNLGLDTDSRTNDRFENNPYQAEASDERTYEHSDQNWGTKPEIPSSFELLDAREISGRLDNAEHNFAKSFFQEDLSHKYPLKNRPHAEFPEQRTTKIAAVKRPVVDPESLGTLNRPEIGAPREEHRHMLEVPDRLSGVRDFFEPQTQVRTRDRLKLGKTQELLDFLKHELGDNDQQMNVTDRLDLQHRQHPLKATNRLESLIGFDGPPSKDATGYSDYSTHLQGPTNVGKALEPFEVSTEFAEEAKQSWDYDSSVYPRSETAATWKPRYSYQDAPCGNQEILPVPSTKVANPKGGFSSAGQSQSVVNRLESGSSSNVEYNDYSLPTRTISPTRFNRQSTHHQDDEPHTVHYESSRSQRPVPNEDHRHGNRLAKASSPRSVIKSDRVESRHTEDYDRGCDLGTVIDNTRGENGFHSLPAYEKNQPFYGQAFNTSARLRLDADDLSEHNTGHFSSFKPRFEETDHGLPARHSATTDDHANLPSLQRRHARDLNCQPSNIKQLRTESSARLEPRVPHIRRRSPEAVEAREAVQHLPAPPIKRYTPLFPLPSSDDVDERIYPGEEDRRQFSREGSLVLHHHREPSLHRYEGNATGESLTRDVRKASSSTSRVATYHVPHDRSSYCIPLGRSLSPSAAPAISAMDVGLETYEYDRVRKRSRSADSPRRSRKPSPRSRLESSPRPRLGRYPPQARLENSPPRAGLGQSPLRTRLGNSPPRDRHGRSPPRVRLENSSPRARLGRSPMRARFENSPPRTRLDRSPPLTRLENSLPRTRLEISPNRARQGRSPQTRLDRSPLRGMLECSPPRDRFENSPTRTRLENLPPQPRFGNSAPLIGLGRSPLRDRLENSPPRARLERSPPRARLIHPAPRAKRDDSPPRTRIENSASRGKPVDSHRTKRNHSPLRHRLENSPPRARLGRFLPQTMHEEHPAHDAVRARLDRSPVRARVDKPLRRGLEKSPLRSDGKRSSLGRIRGKSPLPRVDNDKSYIRNQRNGSPRRLKSPARRTVSSHQSTDISPVSGLSRALQERISRRSKSVEKRSTSLERKSTVPVRDPKDRLVRHNTIHSNQNQKNRGGVNTSENYRDAKSKNNSIKTTKSSNSGPKAVSVQASVKRKLETDSSSRSSPSKKVSLDTSSNEQPKVSVKKAAPLAKKKSFTPIVFTPEDFGKKPDVAGVNDEGQRSLKDSSSATQISTSNTRTSSSQKHSTHSRTSSGVKSVSTSNVSRPSPATPSSTTRPSTTTKPSTTRPSYTVKLTPRPSSTARVSTTTKPSTARPLSSTRPSTARLSSTAVKASTQLLSSKGSGCEVSSSRAVVRGLRDDIAKFGGDKRAAAATSSQEELRLLLLKAKEIHVEQKLRDLEKKEKETAKKLRSPIVW